MVAAYFFPSGVAWTHGTLAGIASAVARELAARIFSFFTTRCLGSGVFFSLHSASGYNSGSGGPCCQLWHAAKDLSMPTYSPAKVMQLICRLPTCHVQASNSRGCIVRLSRDGRHQ